MNNEYQCRQCGYRMVLQEEADIVESYNEVAKHGLTRVPKNMCPACDRRSMGNAGWIRIHENQLVRQRDERDRVITDLINQLAEANR